MRERCFGGSARQHAGNLDFPASIGHKCQFGGISIAFYDVVRVTAHSHLRQVGHDDDLVGACKVGYHIGKRVGRGSANSRVHFVEDEIRANGRACMPAAGR